jgi:hypothetical protein
VTAEYFSQGGGGGGAVTSVAGRTGVVVLTAADVGAGQLPTGVLLPSGIVIPSGADISGILGTSGSKVAAGNDSRLSNARTPTAHKGSHATGGSDAFSAGDLDPSFVAGTAVVAADSRLSDARTPIAHKATHATGGSDPLAASDIGAAVAPSLGAGLWYSPQGSNATLLMVENKLYAMAVDLPIATTLRKIGLEVTTVGGASGVIRLGVYADSGGLPAARILDAGTIDGTILFSTTPGAVTGLTQAIGPGRIWLVAASQAQAGTQATVRAIAINLPWMPKTVQPGGAGQTNTGIVENGTATTGALPSTFPVCDSGSTLPRVCFST